jgi:GNAT superfamily N-acetyltransferase
MRVAVIGGGPMGFAAAIGAADRGWDVTLLERDEIGASLRQWGPTRFFSPLSTNVSPRMRRARLLFRRIAQLRAGERIPSQDRTRAVGDHSGFGCGDAFLMSLAITIRHATPGDAAAMAALAGELGYPTRAAEMDQRLTACLAAASDHAVLVAESGKTVVGWIQVSVVVSLETGAFAEIRALVVSESQRGAGIGTKLVEAGEAWAASRDISRIRVRSNVTRERTRGFYEGLGYATIKTQRVFEKTFAAGGGVS